MHHQLDDLGCPSLCCTLAGKEPENSWLVHTKFPNFVRGLLVQLWELIQHSRFNLLLLRVFKCGPESARDGEYRSYIARRAVPMYGLCGQGGHASLVMNAPAIIAFMESLFLLSQSYSRYLLHCRSLVHIHASRFRCGWRSLRMSPRSFSKGRRRFSQSSSPSSKPSSPTERPWYVPPHEFPALLTSFVPA